MGDLFVGESEYFRKKEREIWGALFVLGLMMGIMIIVAICFVMDRDMHPVARFIGMTLSIILIAEISDMIIRVRQAARGYFGYEDN